MGGTGGTRPLSLLRRALRLGDAVVRRIGLGDAEDAGELTTKDGGGIPGFARRPCGIGDRGIVCDMGEALLSGSATQDSWKEEYNLPALAASSQEIARIVAKRASDVFVGVLQDLLWCRTAGSYHSFCTVPGNRCSDHQHRPSVRQQRLRESYWGICHDL
jgi:hypothetical protein